MPNASIPEIGKPVLLPPTARVVRADIDKRKDVSDCMPPTAGCQAYSVDGLWKTTGLCDVHFLAFEIVCPKVQKLEIWIEIAAGDCAYPVFMTKGQTIHMQTDKKTLVGLDPRGAKAAQPFFVSGNTIALAVQPKSAEVTVSVGKLVNHGGKKADPPRRGRR
jgi:hypothetical protein